MIQVSNFEIFNFPGAIRGMRNPLESWDKSDSGWTQYSNGKPVAARYANDMFIVGDNDLALMRKLARAGSDHRKYLRQIFVSVDILAPLYWWKEYDTYKVGTVANSTSTMHKIHAKPFTIDDFSAEKLYPKARFCLEYTIDMLNYYRDLYNETGNRDDWMQMIQLLPTSYNQMRTCTFTYENLYNMHQARKNHKLEEWRNLCKWFETLPYFKEIFLETE